MIYLKEHELFTLEDLDVALQGMSEKSKSINAAMKKASARMKSLPAFRTPWQTARPTKRFMTSI